jgi:hypothetical protein
MRVDRFSLERHKGPEESWPLRSRLFLDGQPTRIRLWGHYLRHQFEIPAGYILICDDDCQFEEVTHFSLVSRKMRLMSWRFAGWVYCSFAVSSLRWLDDRHLKVLFSGGDDDPFLLTIRRWNIPYLHPRLALRRMKAWRDAHLERSL